MIMPSVRVILLGGMQEPGHAAGSTLMGLFSRPDQWARVQAAPDELIAPAVNEGLRWMAPIGVVDRQSDRDVELRGQTIPAGSLVEVVMASANRDESRFDNPDSYDIDRAARAHHAFGYGQHFCAGHFFARRVEQIIFEEIVKGLPNLRPKPDTTPKVTGWVFRGPKHFPVEWDRVAKRDTLPLAIRTTDVNPVSTPDTPVNTRILRVKSLERVATGVLQVGLEDPDGAELPTWSPGAHIDLWIKPDRATQYSLCGSLDDRRVWKVAVQQTPESTGGSRFIHERLRPGMLVHVGEPRNHFELRPAARYVFVAGGIGITPIVSMLASTRAAGAEAELIYCGRDRASMAYLADLENEGYRLAAFPRDEGPRADLKAIVAAAAAKGATLYLCGPTGMRDAVARHAEDLGVALATESFDSGQAHQDDDFAFEITLAKSGRRLTVGAGETILEVLAANGFHVRQSCKAGNCGSCETAIIEGQADHRDVLLTSRQRAENARLMVCVSRAKSADAPLVLDL